MPITRGVLPAAVALAALMSMPAAAAAPGRVTGIGGVFVSSKDPAALARWYRDVLGLDVKSWGGAAFPFDLPGHPPKISWAAFPPTSDQMAPSTRAFMINFAVDDMDAILTRVAAHGVAVLKRDDSNDFGRFAWIMDPDGTKIELWQPKAGPAGK